MVATPFQLQYTLSRRQRLVLHLRRWGVVTTVLVTLLFLFFCSRVVVSARELDGAGLAVFGGLSLFVFLLTGGAIVGLLDVAFVPTRRVDIVVEDNALGILLGGERWYLFLDGITSLEKLGKDLWTLQHWNGCVLHISDEVMTDALLTHLRAAMIRGRTPEDGQAVIERGRRFQ
jgi:hypothetical protein